MVRKIGLFLILVMCSLNFSGCIFLLAGGAVVVGGVGTAKWLSDKLVEEVNASYDRATQGARDGLNDLKLDITKVTTTDAVTEINCKYSDGRSVWVNIYHVSSNVSRLEVRVGVWGGQSEARQVLDGILEHLK